MTRPDAATLWLAAPLAMALLPHLTFLPAWVGVAAFIALAWRLSPLWRKDSNSQKRARLVLVAIAIGGVLFEHHTLFGPQGGVSFLVLMAMLKLLESQGRRDQIVVTLAGYFLLVTVLIHDQRLPTAAWLLLTAVVLTASLVATQTRATLGFRKAFRTGGTLLLQGLPLALLLFVLFPRLHSPIGVFLHSGQGQTGLSDSMRPGSISELIRSDAIALRADFGTPDVDGRHLYWRGPVLSNYDGLTWTRAATDHGGGASLGQGAQWHYTVTLEPSQLRWLPVTGLVARLGLDRARETADGEWLAPRPVVQRVRYAVDAWQDYLREPDLSPYRMARSLELPEGFNPETVALGQRWRAQYGTPQAVVDAALAYFRDQPFYYTLNPPEAEGNAVDDFMFRSRRGFCEHYAGAFTVLMRAAGIPARVVTGYLGGEYNPLGQYWIVRQRDAHAWSEVWLAGRGWVRVDPTAAIAPSRIEADTRVAAVDSQPVAMNLPSTWLRPLRQTWDFVNNGWNQWVLGYDFERQRRTLNALSPSLASLRGMLWTLLAGGALLIGVMSFIVLRASPARRIDKATRLYGRFLHKLNRLGLDKAPAEGADSFALRAIRKRPDLTREIAEITRLYNLLRYGVPPSEALDRLEQAVKSFRTS